MNQPLRLSNIVVGVDESENARTALTWACRVASRHVARVEAVRAHAHPISPLVPALSATGVVVDQLVASPRAQLRATVESIATGVEITETVVMRSPQFALEQASHNADLVVVGRTGRSRLENLLVGSTAGYCVHKSRCPVALIGPQLPGETIIVAVDGSDRSVRALQWALHVWPVAQVVAVYSHDESILDELAFDHAQRRQLDAVAATVLASTVSAACASMPVTPAAVRTDLRAGDPRTTIVGQLAADELLVLGTQGHSGLTGLMLGSLADFAVHNAAGSVVVHR